MHIGVLLVGDELLSGKRHDKHLPQLIDILATRGLSLSWVQIVGDDIEQLSRSLRHSMEAGDLVLSFGGIGATQDDVTRQSAARAAGVELVLHQEAAAIIKEKSGDKAYPHRIKMAEFPQGARLIPNPVNRVAGFSLGHQHFMPGFPNMAWPMAEWVLDQHYSHLFPSDPAIEHLFHLDDIAESDLIPIMDELLNGFCDIKIACLPDTGVAGRVELGIKGPRASVDAASQRLSAYLDQETIQWRPGQDAATQ